MRGVGVGKDSIDVYQAGLYPASPALESIEGRGSIVFGLLARNGTIAEAGKNLDKGVVSKTNMHYCSWSPCPTKSLKFGTK